MTVFQFLERLKAAKVSFVLGTVRDESIMVSAALPGERWEIEFFADGTVESEVFVSSGGVEGGLEAVERFLIRAENDD